jgi:dihydrofolate synthase/folylpolyglutamate synthase
VPNIFKHGACGRSVRLEAALARLDALVNWEKKARSTAAGKMRVSLAPARALCERLGDPQRRYRVVHVAGTKGKGSVSTLVAAALRRAGIHEGLYTSPHVDCVQERLQLSGRPVEDELLARHLEAALDAHAAERASAGPGGDATWFDVLTTAAFLVLAEERVELAVVECGLGGRLDSTNVADGLVCAITNVYLEHTAILGDTRTAIAAEKAGIIKPGSTVVAGALGADDAATRVVEAIARERGARFVRVEYGEAETLDERNRRLAAEILLELERAAPDLAARGIRPAPLGAHDHDLARLPGRAERRTVAGVRVVLDGAHVPESLALLLRDLARDPELARPPVVVLGMGLEKNALGMLKALQGGVDRVLCTSVGEGPYRGADELTAIARELGLAAVAVSDPMAALDRAVRSVGAGGWVLVTGSLHLVGAVRCRTEPTESVSSPRCSPSSPTSS